MATRNIHSGSFPTAVSMAGAAFHVILFFAQVAKSVRPGARGQLIPKGAAATSGESCATGCVGRLS